jgi:hypothetical protein
MNPLNEIVEEMQRRAAALPTADLRDHIQACLEVLTEDIDVAQRLGPSAPRTQVITATDNVMITALATALYVRELTTRPADRQFARVWFSFN